MIKFKEKKVLRKKFKYMIKKIKKKVLTFLKSKNKINYSCFPYQTNKSVASLVNI